MSDPGSLDDCVGPVRYTGPWGRPLNHRVYLFDQEMAHRGVWYYATLARYGRRWALQVWVPFDRWGEVLSVIAELNQR